VSPGPLVPTTKLESYQRLRDDLEDSSPKKPHDNNFKQHRLSVCIPSYSFRCVILTYLILGLVFIPLGGVFFYVSRHIVHASASYQTSEGASPCENTPFSDFCNVTVYISQDMSPPIYFYYALTNFYQNHRSYVMSRDDHQLQGEQSSSNCAPLVHYGDKYGGKNASLLGKTLYPCGLVANSFFNDEFSSATHCSAGRCFSLANDWHQDGIAWASDLRKLFIPQPLEPSMTRESNFPYPNPFTLPNVTDPNLVVWMRPSISSWVSKFNRRILNTTFKAGDIINVTVQINYPLNVFAGTKSVLFHTSSFMGGHDNYFLSAFYLTVGTLCLVLALIFYCRSQARERPLHRYIAAFIAPVQSPRPHAAVSAFPT